MDDICLIIPNTSAVEDELALLDKELDKIGLQRSIDKTEEHSYEQFAKSWYGNENEELDKIARPYERLTNSLWYANDEFRDALQTDDAWWRIIQLYRARLRSIDIYVEPDRLSRKVHQYLSRRKRQRDMRSNLVEELRLPDLDAHNWLDAFLAANKDWVECRDRIRRQLESMLRESFGAFKNAQDGDQTKRNLQRKIAFSVYRLPRLGLAGTQDLLEEMLTDFPWIIMKPGPLLRSLGGSGLWRHH